MNLESLAAELRGFVGVTRKKQIGELISFFPIESKQIIASFGEDAAVIDDGDEVMLFAADGIWSKLMDADPEWSGYCSVLVNVHDIAAMGGWPVAMVDVLSAGDPEISKRVLQGMKKGIEKLGVPIIGGHLHPDTPYSALDVAILGKAKKNAVILSSTAQPGEVVIAAYDTDGSPHPKFQLSFDSTSFKESSVLAEQLGAMRELGESGLVRAGKLGGFRAPGPAQPFIFPENFAIDLELPARVEHAEALAFAGQRLFATLAGWLQMYPGMGFVVTTRSENQEKVLEVFTRRGLTARVIGRVTEERKLIIRSGKEEAVLFDLARECVTGIH